MEVPQLEEYPKDMRKGDVKDFLNERTKEEKKEKYNKKKQTKIGRPLPFPSNL